MNPGTYGQHRRFCEIDDWTSRDTDHTHYTKILSDGTILRTKVSHGADSTRYGAGLWSRIPKQQLEVTEDAFYKALTDKKPVSRGMPEPPSGPRIPLWLVQNLQTHVGLAEKEALALSPEEARQRWDVWISQPGDEAPGDA